MKPYTFYLHDIARPTPAFDFIAFDDDDEALRHARALLASRPEYLEIEVFDGGDVRLKVSREVNALVS